MMQKFFKGFDFSVEEPFIPAGVWIKLLYGILLHFFKDLSAQRIETSFVPYLFIATLHLPQGIIISFSDPTIRIVLNLASSPSSVNIVPIAFSSP